MSLKAGDRTALNVTQKSKYRIFVGLGWDPNEAPKIGDKISALLGKREIHHDLDLSCFYYDKDEACLGYVSALPDHHSDESGAIYHSGDNVEGVGDGDDEQISVELKTLPDTIHHLVFKVSIKSGHHFGEVNEPHIRLCDGYTGRCFFDKDLNCGNSADKDAYVFVHISRQGHDDWHLHIMDAYHGNMPLEDWQSHLAQYLT